MTVEIVAIDLGLENSPRNLIEKEKEKEYKRKRHSENNLAHDQEI